MKNLFLIFLLITKSAIGQINCGYTFNQNLDTITFTNQSTAQNAHYYWSFGDGDGSHEINPKHIFPDDGDYLVTLFALDTIADTTCYYEEWIHVAISNISPCQLNLTDTIIYYPTWEDYQLLLDYSTNGCDGLHTTCDIAGPAQHYCNPGLDTLWGFSLFMAGVQAYTYDSVYSYRVFKNYFKTIPFQYSSAVNYQNCSPNFEVTVEYQTDGAKVYMNSMNREGDDTFWISGFGNGIPIDDHSAYFISSYLPYEKFRYELIYYEKVDTISGCSVRGTKQIILRNPNYKFPINCSILEQPQSQVVTEGQDVKFYIVTQNTVEKQWQQDDGFGFFNLKNSGKYSGVNTDTLCVTSVTSDMNNVRFRCRIKENNNNCRNTSNEAMLTVKPLKDVVVLYPNPARDFLTVLSSSEPSPSEINIYNILGEKRISKAVNSKKTVIDLQNEKPGVYFVEAKYMYSSFWVKFVKV